MKPISNNLIMEIENLLGYLYIEQRYEEKPSLRKRKLLYIILLLQFLLTNYIVILFLFYSSILYFVIDIFVAVSKTIV